MACPTCDCTLQGCGYGIWHCGRCGTMVKDDAVYIPALVTRCRGFEGTITGVCAQHAHLWKTYGIREAINRPDDRGPERGDRP